MLSVVSVHSWWIILNVTSWKPPSSSSGWLQRDPINHTASNRDLLTGTNVMFSSLSQLTIGNFFSSIIPEVFQKVSLCLVEKLLCPGPSLVHCHSWTVLAEQRVTRTISFGNDLGHTLLTKINGGWKIVMVSPLGVTRHTMVKYMTHVEEARGAGTYVGHQA